MGNKLSYKKIDKENTKLNIYMYDPQNDMSQLTLFERNIEKEKHYKGIELYSHKYFSINIYKFEILTNNKIKQIIDIIKAKKNKANEEYQNLVIYIEEKNYQNNNNEEKNYYNLLKEIIKLDEEDQPLLLFFHHDNKISKKNYIEFLKNLYANGENSYLYKKIDLYSITVLKYHESNFKEILFNEIWDAVSYYNQIPYLTFPSMDSNDISNFKSFNLYTLNLLLVGDSGAGKSTFINILKGKKIAYESRFSSTKTVQINEYLIEHFFNNDNRKLKIGMKLVDTLGFSTENIEKEKLLKYTKQIYYEGVKNKDKIHVLLYFINSDNVNRMFTNVQIDFLNFIMNEDKNLKILFIINKSLKPKFDKEGHSIESEEKRLFKKNIKTYFKEENIKRLIEQDETNIIELNLKYNKKTNTEPFGIKNFLHKLFLLFRQYYIKNENLTPSNTYNNNINSFFLNDIKDINDIFKKIFNQTIKILNISLITASIVSYSPVPLIDNAVILSLDIYIVLMISNIFGFNITKENSKAILKSLLIGKDNKFKLLRFTGYALKFVDLIGDGLKFIPIIGTIVGGGISNVGNAGEVYFVYKQIIKYYIDKITEEQCFAEILIKLTKYYNDNIDGLNEFYNNFREDYI